MKLDTGVQLNLIKHNFACQNFFKMLQTDELVQPPSAALSDENYGTPD